LIDYLRLAVRFFRTIVRTHLDVKLENLALQQQLMVLSRPARRPRLTTTDRLFWSWLSRWWPGWRRPLVLVQPDTVVRWHRLSWRRYWTWRSGRRPGRPHLPKELQELIQRMARENPRWGSVRIRGELRGLGIDVSAESVRCYRRRVLRRPPSQTWRTFLRNHAPHIWAADFFTVPTVTFHTLYVFFVVAHARRRLVHFNITAHPGAEWVWRQVIAATPWGEQPRYLIRDRDRCYGGSFIPRAARIGIETLLTPVRSPKANAIAERLVGTLRRECLDHSDHLQRAAPAPDPYRVRGALQHGASAPQPGVGGADPEGGDASAGARTGYRATGARWPPSRIRMGRRMNNWAPQPHAHVRRARPGATCPL
jgi:transposase InsO family protein